MIKHNLITVNEKGFKMFILATQQNIYGKHKTLHLEIHRISTTAQVTKA